jgi:hypothetical protein
MPAVQEYHRCFQMEPYRCHPVIARLQIVCIERDFKAFPAEYLR